MNVANHINIWSFFIDFKLSYYHNKKKKHHLIPIKFKRPLQVSFIFIYRQLYVQYSKGPEGSEL